MSERGDLYIHFKRRDGSGGIELPGLRIQVEELSWAAVGGPDTARLVARGDPDGLWELVELLGCPVEVYDPQRAEPVWWGYVETVGVQKDWIYSQVSLEEMANQVTVVYSTLIPGLSLAGARRQTPAANDGESQAAYGVKALRYPTGGSSLDQATALRDTLLQARRWPAARVSIADRPETLATLGLKGWWHTLDWSYYAQPAGRELNEVGGQQDWIGAQAPDTRYGQSFQIGAPAGWDADRIWIRAKTIGGPADILVVEICANSNGAPGAVLAAGTLPGGTIGVSTSMRLFEVLFNTRVSLNPGTTYWIVVRRSGGLDGMNYYMVDTDQSGGGVYSRGALWVWNGSAWVGHTPGADLWFRLSGSQETTAQLAAMLGSNPFFTGLDVEVSSGVWASPYRLGDTHTQTEAEELLKAGTAGGGRLLAQVDVDRRVRVYEAPAPGAADWGLLARGEARNPGDQAARGPAVGGLAGNWARLRDLAPGSADVSRLADLSRVFIEGVVWNRTGGLKINPEN